MSQMVSSTVPEMPYRRASHDSFKSRFPHLGVSSNFFFFFFFFFFLSSKLCCLLGTRGEKAQKKNRRCRIFSIFFFQKSGFPKLRNSTIINYWVRCQLPVSIPVTGSLINPLLPEFFLSFFGTFNPR